MKMTAIAAVAATAIAVGLTGTASAAPCKAHEGKAKRACIKQAKRDAMPFPPHPTMRDLARRVPDWSAFVRLGRCEQPGSGKWGVAWGHKGPTYGGGMGIFRQTWYTAKSPYKLWSSSIPEEILVADAIRDKFGITAWGAWRCFQTT